jgi:hypothetical protein
VSDLERVVKLAELLEEHAANVAELKEELKAAEKALRRVEEEDLPELMSELGLTEIKLENGSVITITEDVKTSITNANAAAAHSWLVENGFGGLIKTAVSVTFGRGDHDTAEAARDALAAEYEDVSLEEKVHHSTLKAFVLEQLRNGQPVPTDLFSVYPYSKAVIKKRS